MACFTGPTTVAAVSTLAELRSLPVPGATDARCHHVMGHTTAGDGGGGTFYWCDDSTSADDDGIVVTPASSPAAGRWRRLVTGSLMLSWWGLRGDGSDETVRLQRAFDAAAGRTLVLDQARTYGFAQTANQPGLTIRANTLLINHGATLLLLERDCEIMWGIVASAIVAEEGLRVDHLRVESATCGVRRFLTIGPGSAIGTIELSAATQQNQYDPTAPAENQMFDGALQIHGAAGHTSIGTVRITNFDLPIRISGCDHVFIEHVELTSYKRGVLVDSCNYFHLLSGVIETMSPYAEGLSPPPDGLNGMLFQNSNDVFVSNLRVSDSFGNSIRLGGGASVQRYAFRNISVTNAGNTAFKIASGDGTEARYVMVNGLSVCDSGKRTTIPESNQEGMRLEKCSHVVVTGFRLSKKDLDYAAFTGIYVKGAELVTIDGASIADTYSHGVHLAEGGGREINLVLLHDPQVLFAGAHALYVDSRTEILRDIVFKDAYLRGYGSVESGEAVYVERPADVRQPVIVHGWVRPGASGIFKYDAPLIDLDVRNDLVAV